LKHKTQNTKYGTGGKLPRAFYERDAEVVARELVGTILVRRIVEEGEMREFRARVVETEAYIGEHDLACHASKGRTKRTEIMFGHGGFAYVYFIYGMHTMLNVVTGKKDHAQAVLIRAAEAVGGWGDSEGRVNLSGPGRLCKSMRVRLVDNGVDLTGEEMFFVSPGKVKKPRIVATPRIGVDYSGDWKHELLRFIDADSAAVSGPRRLNEGGKAAQGA
jgi:DNA-3-methyladenine glycosylase